MNRSHSLLLMPMLGKRMLIPFRLALFMTVLMPNVMPFQNYFLRTQGKCRLCRGDFFMRQTNCLFSTFADKEQTNDGVGTGGRSNDNNSNCTKNRHPDFPEWAYQDRDFFRFEILHQSTKSQARVGRIHTPHGVIDTPGFVAVATNAALKGVDFRTADQDAGQQLIFANTYHLLIHPGSDIIRDAGGIHQWTNRKDRPFITDSGGFQVFSLAYGSVHEELSSKGELKRASSGKKKNKKMEAGRHSDMVQVSEDGAIFRSYRDGTQFLLTPESTVQAQKDIGADIIIPLDELPPYHVDRNRLVESVDR
jgi:hypothetical protein